MRLTYGTKVPTEAVTEVTWTLLCAIKVTSKGICIEKDEMEELCCLFLYFVRYTKKRVNFISVLVNCSWYPNTWNPCKESDRKKIVGKELKIVKIRYLISNSLCQIRLCIQELRKSLFCQITCDFHCC